MSECLARPPAHPAATPRGAALGSRDGATGLLKAASGQAPEEPQENLVFSRHNLGLYIGALGACFAAVLVCFASFAYGSWTCFGLSQASAVSTVLVALVQQVPGESWRKGDFVSWTSVHIAMGFLCVGFRAARGPWTHPCRPSHAVALRLPWPSSAFY